jgi:transglutaminase-like putative cysteine protease
MQRRTVTARVAGTVTEPAHLVWSLAVADHPGTSEEALTVTVDGRTVEVREVAGPHGGRLHVVEGAPTGELELTYRAVVDGAAPPQEASELDLITYRFPSRYADSDRLGAVAAEHMQGLDGVELVERVDDWVHRHLAYVSGSSRPTDGAVDSYLARSGVCRDFAHLAVAFLRAGGLPARLAAVYAPGLSPMDFHAVAEYHLDGRWNAIDPTRLAPRASMLRIATGRDAADTAFLNVLDGRFDLGPMEVTAVVDGGLPEEDPDARVALV